MTKEIWRPVVGYENYMVSNLGVVKSLSRDIDNRRGIYISKERILKLSKDGSGYPLVKLYKDGIGKQKKVHRLVAEAFIINTENKKEVNHEDGVKDNNIVSNLSWATGSENISHAFRKGLNVAARGSQHYKSIKIINKKTGECYENASDFAIKNNISSGYVWKMLNGKRKNKYNIEELYSCFKKELAL